MRLTLVRPPMLVSRFAHTAPTCPPIGIAYLAGAARAAGHEVHVVDAVAEDIFRFEPFGRGFLLHGLPVEAIVERVPRGTQVVGLSLMFSHELPIARRLVEALRAALPAVTLLVGGEHVTALPAETLCAMPAIDAGVLGEGEETLTELLACLGRGGDAASVPGVVVRGDPEPRFGPPRSRLRAIDAIPPPAWDLLPLETYLGNEKGFGVNRGRSMPVLATRGCPYRCTFCSSPAMWTTSWVARDPAKLLDEMEGYRRAYRIDNFDFYDLTAIVKRDWIVRFCRLILERGHTFTWQLPSGTRSEAIDAEVAELLHRSGCRNVSYAPESGCPETLVRIKKKVDLARMRRSMTAAVRAGLNVKANVLLGFPGETRRHMLRSLAFVARLGLSGLHDVSVTAFSPYPGSELFRELRKAGRIPELTDDYYLGLASYTDVSGATSWSEHVGGSELALYRLAGMLGFYALAFGTRPWRVAGLVRHTLSSRQESRLQMSLHDMLLRLRARAGAGA